MDRTIRHVISEAVASMTGTDQSSFDAEYEKAVSSGDTEAALRMIRDRASTKMPDTKVVDQDGKPKVVYRGEMSSDIPKEFRFGFGLENELGEYEFDVFRRVMFTSSRDVAKNFTAHGGTVGSYFIKMENPLEYDNESRYWYQMLKNGPSGKNNFGIILDEFLDMNMGEHDGAIIRNIKEGGYGVDSNEIVAEDYILNPDMPNSPKKIKSADITYDDSGNLIPLSKRFDFSNPDIRY